MLIMPRGDLVFIALVGPGDLHKQSSVEITLFIYNVPLSGTLFFPEHENFAFLYREVQTTYEDAAYVQPEKLRKIYIILDFVHYVEKFLHIFRIKRVPKNIRGFQF